MLHQDESVGTRVTGRQMGTRRLEGNKLFILQEKLYFLNQYVWAQSVAYLKLEGMVIFFFLFKKLFLPDRNSACSKISLFIHSFKNWHDASSVTYENFFLRRCNLCRCFLMSLNGLPINYWSFFLSTACQCTADAPFFLQCIFTSLPAVWLISVACVTPGLVKMISQGISVREVTWTSKVGV